MPEWWNGIHSGLKSHRGDSCEFESRLRYVNKDDVKRAFASLMWFNMGLDSEWMNRMDDLANMLP